VSAIEQHHLLQRQIIVIIKKRERLPCWFRKEKENGTCVTHSTHAFNSKIQDKKKKKRERPGVHERKKKPSGLNFCFARDGWWPPILLLFWELRSDDSSGP
jgi:hypothetical protein